MPLIPIHESPHLVVQAETEPLQECEWFWVNGHRVPRAEMVSMMVNLSSQPMALRGGELTAYRMLGGVFTDEEMTEIGFDMAGP